MPRSSWTSPLTVAMTIRDYGFAPRCFFRFHERPRSKLGLEDDVPLRPDLQDLRKPLRHACEAAKVTYKRNALRHSFGSYRVETTKNAGQVSLEMGNSAAIVMKHYYFDIVEASAAKDYWNIKPLGRDDRKVVALC